jgi:hypothetical protein
MKAAAFIMLALFIDGIQAAVSASLALIAAFPGTVGGAAAGCAVGNGFFGSWGCTIGGFIFGLLGTSLDVLAPVTEPIGLAIGFAVSICLSMTFGAGLIMLLLLNGMYYPKFLLPGGIAELIPGFDLIPSWTAMTILCVLQKSKEESGLLGGVASVAAAAASPTPASISNAVRTVDGIRGPEAQTHAA